MLCEIFIIFSRHSKASKIVFFGLKIQFGAKILNLEALIANIGCLRPSWLSELVKWLSIQILSWGMLPKLLNSYSRALKSCFLGLEIQFDIKLPYFGPLQPKSTVEEASFASRKIYKHIFTI